MRIEAPLRRKNSILLTSLVDVMFVLLFFFMLASSYLEWHTLSLNLGGSGAQAQSTGEAPWTLQVLVNGQYALNGEFLPLASIHATLTQQKGRKLVLQPGPGVTLQELVAVLDELKPSGAVLVLGKLPQ